MMEEVLLELPHIKLIHLENGEYCLMVEDTELNDYVEDFLWDDYEYMATTVTMQGRTGPVVYNNFFPADFPIADLIEALKGLDVAEVERVFRLNN
jgi:hypothetical protein